MPLRRGQPVSTSAKGGEGTLAPAHKTRADVVFAFVDLRLCTICEARGEVTCGAVLPAIQAGLAEAVCWLNEIRPWNRHP